MSALLTHVETQIVRPAHAGGIRTFRLAESVDGIGRQGEIVTMSVLPSDTADQLAVVDTYISGYRPFAFTADMVSPVVIVPREKGKRLDRSANSAFSRVNTAVGRQGQINEIQDANARTDFATLEYGLGAFIPWASENDELDIYNIRTATSQMLADLLLLDREVRIWTFLTTSGNWATNNTTSLSGAARWDTTTANPRLDIQNRMDASLQAITDMWMNPDVAFWFLSNTDVRAYLRQFMGDNAPAPDMARAANAQGYITFELFGLPRVHICPAKYLVSGTPTYVLGKNVVLTSMPPATVPRDMFTVATTLTFRHRGKSGNGWVTNEYIPDGRGINGGRMLETGFGEVAFMGSNQAGGLIQTVIS